MEKLEAISVPGKKFNFPDALKCPDIIRAVALRIQKDNVV